MKKLIIATLAIGWLFLVTCRLSAQIQLLNDEFDDPGTATNWIDINAEEGWNIAQLEAWNVDGIQEGSLYMKPFTVSWYEEYRGAFLFKYISGDFVITTEVKATGHDGISRPSSDFSLAGVMVRAPVHYLNQDPLSQWMPNQQNYIFMSIGQANQPNYSFEIKNTCNSSSCLDIRNIGDVNTTKIRMARIGQYIIVLNQFSGQPWQVRNRYNRAGLQCADWGSACNAPFPDTLQIGFVTYTDWPKVSSLDVNFHNSHTIHPDSLGMDDPTPLVPFSPDLIATFDYARFDSVTVPEALSGLDLTDTTVVTDQDLLSFLGYDTQRHCPDQYQITDDISNTYLTVKAGQSIMAGNTIGNDAQVSFRAGNQVDLLPGFEVGPASVLQISIEGCGDH